MRFPHSVFRRGASMLAQLCLVYQHYWLQVMFWTESIWPLEGLKYIIVQRETSWDSGYTVCAALSLTLRHADKVATTTKKTTLQHTWISTFYSGFQHAAESKNTAEVLLAALDSLKHFTCLHFACFGASGGGRRVVHSCGFWILWIRRWFSLLLFSPCCCF